MPKISVLVSARKNSKFLAKFLFGLAQNTTYPQSIEVLIMLNEHDTWNAELAKYCDQGRWPFKVWCQYEDLQLGRAGLHEYFNLLYTQATGQWIIYFCDDHFVTMDGWDKYVQEIIAGDATVETETGPALKHPHGFLDHTEPWCIVPKFDNAGAMNQILSRGYCETLGGLVGRHGWIDSYINDVNAAAFGSHPKRVLLMDQEMIHDFTHDQPNPMDNAHQQSVVSEAGKLLPKHGSEVYKHRVQVDAEKLRLAVERLA